MFYLRAAIGFLPNPFVVNFAKIKIAGKDMIINTNRTYFWIDNDFGYHSLDGVKGADGERDLEGGGREAVGENGIDGENVCVLSM